MKTTWPMKPAVAMTAAVASAVFGLAVTPTPAGAACGDIVAGPGLTIEAAVAEANSCPGTETVWIEPGVYAIDDPLDVDKNVIVRGTDPSDPPTIGIDDMAFALDPVVDALTIIDADIVVPERFGLVAAFDVDVVLTRMSLDAGTDNGCQMDESPGLWLNGGSLMMTDSAFRNTSCNAISAFNNAVVDVRGSTFDTADGHGIDLSLGAELTIADSTISGARFDGVRATLDAGPVDAERVRIFGNGQAGVDVRSELTMVDSVLGIDGDDAPAGNGESGVEVNFGAVTLSGVVSSNNSETGLAVASLAAPASVSASSFSGNGGEGLRISASTVNLEESTIIGNAPACVLLAGGAAIDRGGNTIDDLSCGFDTADTTAPVFTGAGDHTLVGPMGTMSLPAVYRVQAIDAIDGERPVVCTPAAGASLTVGTHDVTCSASDLSGNTAMAVFEITVQVADDVMATSGATTVGLVKVATPIDMTASGFEPLSIVDLWFRSEPTALGTAEADANGTISAQITVPATATNGRHHVTAAGVDADGNPYEVMVPVTVTGVGGAVAPLTCATDDVPFVDVAVSSFAFESVGCIFDLGITQGTSATTYSPGGFVTRAQMAAFLERMWVALGGTCATDDVPFVDVAVSSFAFESVGCIFDLGITQGTSATTYSPGGFVTRAQMAAFLARLVGATGSGS